MRADVLILGGGAAGMAAAIQVILDMLLHKQG